MADLLEGLDLPPKPLPFSEVGRTWGAEKLIRTTRSGLPVFICDNDNVGNPSP